VLDLLRVVSTLSYLKKFHFPDSGCSAYSALDEGQGEDTPRWPDSLETFHIPSSLDTCYLIAFEKPPASLKSLIVEEMVYPHKSPTDEVLDKVFGLIGSRILTLKMDYEVDSVVEAWDIFEKFPNLLYLGIRTVFIYDDELSQMDLKIDHPLRSVTLLLDRPDDIYYPGFLDRVKDLLNIDWLPNIRNLRLSDQPSPYRWAHLLQEISLPIAETEPSRLLDIGRCLKQRSSSGSGPRESGVWLVDGRDNDAIICEFTEEDIARFMSGKRV
jgi:hypothetical protein